MKQSKKLILASASPRRKFLLEQVGLSFSIIVSNVDENIDPSILPDTAVKMLAYEKAQDVQKKLNQPAIILGADTTVVIDNLSLGKPKDFKEAFQMLKSLSNRTHSVITGISIIDTYNQKTYTESITSKVTFRKLSDLEITTYIKTGEPMDKAGSYGIQNIGSLFIKNIRGCYNNIVGLPVFRVCQIFEECGINILELNVKQ